MKTIKETYKTENLATPAEEAAWKMYQEQVIPDIKRRFEKNKSLDAVVYIGNEVETEGRQAVEFVPMSAHMFMENTMTKDLLEIIIKAIAKKMDPVCICLMTEAWMLKADKDNYKEAIKKGISNHPEKVEILMCTFESENIIKSKVWEIKRNPLSLVSNTDMEGCTGMEGRFVGMLKDLKKAKQN